MEARVCFAFVLVILCLFFFGLGSCQATSWSRIINITSGSLIGTTQLVLNESVTAYKGIPYAEPPEGSLRFAKPQPKDPWQGVLNATEYGPSCPQPVPSVPSSEDCLTLNIFVPEANVSSEGILPVMVWIHGGGFDVGSASYYEGSILAALGRVVVVTINYRLGVLGFLSTGDDTAKGNYGLWDQRLAIQWVKENIAYFDGDPEMITIFGESAGAISAAMQAISPLNDRSLFQRVILESGTAHQVFTNSHQEVATRTRLLGSLLQCEELADSGQLIDCLRDASVDDILAAGSQLPVEIVQLSPYYPIVDGDFLPDYPHRLSALGLASQYDFVVGINSDEGSIAIGIIPLFIDSLVMSFFMGETIKSIYQCSNYQELAETAKFLYTAGSDLEDQRRNTRVTLDVAGDSIFLAPAVVTARGHSRLSYKYNNSANAYMYYFTYLSEVETNPFPPDLVDGAGHGFEIPFVFGRYVQTHPESVSASLSESMVGFWTNFAKTGDPNGDGLPEWPKYEPENETYIILEPNITTGQHLKAEKMAMWNDYIPSVAVPADPNTQCSTRVPLGSGTVDKSDTKTVEIRSGEGYVLGSVVGSLRVADEAMGGKEIAEFLGIPYAKPPLGDLRFRPPKDVGSWGDEPLGIPEMLPPACPQDITKDPWMVRLGFNQTSEDCLTLNIYAPTTGDGLPVVVFIHPGSGLSGTSSIYDAILLASELKAAVVVPNYRLGALGFLTTGDDKAPGNYGLHDVLAALTWVNKYIGSFGGDARRVTIVGYGAGAELAHFLVLSEKAKDLFQQAVLMSSTAISPPIDNQVQPNASEKAQALAKAVDCPITNSDLMIKCLRKKPASDFVLQTQNPKFGRAFPVVVDQDILKDSPINILKAGKFNNVDLIVGMTWDDNAGQSFHLLPSNLSYCPATDEIKLLIQEVSRLSFHNPEVASVALATEYLGKGGLDDTCQSRGSFRQFMQDYMSVWSTLETARLHSDNGNSVYVYSFDHEPLQHYNSFLPALAGPSHADDLQFLFGDPYSHLADELHLPYRLQDNKMSLEFMASLMNFVHDGHPEMSLSGWPTFDSDNFRFMTLDTCPDARLGLDYDWDHTLRFWSDLILSITAPPTITPPGPTVSKPCIVGKNIGLSLSVEDAATLIEALMGVTIGLLVVVVFVIGGCVAYRARAIKAESGKFGDGGIAMAVGNNYTVGEKPYEMVNDIVTIEAESEAIYENPKDQDQYNENIEMSSFKSE